MIYFIGHGGFWTGTFVNLSNSTESRVKLFYAQKDNLSSELDRIWLLCKWAYWFYTSILESYWGHTGVLLVSYNHLTHLVILSNYIAVKLIHQCTQITRILECKDFRICLFIHSKDLSKGCLFIHIMCLILGT